MKKKFILTATLFLVLSASLNVQAGGGSLSANVLRTLVHTSLFGRCMAFLDKPISTATNSPNCPSAWVTFSCSGDFAPTEVAYRMLDQAQLAKVTGRPVLVVVDDNRTHNTFCFASRIDVL